MLTPSEYLTNKVPDNHEFWLSGMAIVEHCLQRDLEQSFYHHQSAADERYAEWVEAMSERAQSNDSFNDIYDNAYTPKQQYESYCDDTGDLDVSSYIAGDDDCFDDEREMYSQGDCCSILLDMGIAYNQRESSDMIDRHQKVYDIIAQCDSENRPVQVIGVLCIKIQEHKEPIKIFVVVKDYDDCIFPAIWGTLKTNKSTNAFINNIMDFFIGTHSGGNGSLRVLEKAEQYFQDNEELHIFGKRITATNTKNKGQ